MKDSELIRLEQLKMQHAQHLTECIVFAITLKPVKAQDSCDKAGEILDKLGEMWVEARGKE